VSERKRIEDLLERALVVLRESGDLRCVEAFLRDAIAICKSPLVSTEDRARRAIELRDGGMKIHEVGAEIGCERERARQLIELGRRMRNDEEQAAREGPLTDESSVDLLDLPVRAHNALSWAEIRKVGELRAKSDQELRRIRSMGKRTVAAIRAELARHGFR